MAMLNALAFNLVRSPLFLVNSPSGTVFLKLVDTSDVIKDAKQMFELWDSVAEEIWEDNAVQVMTDVSG